MSNSTRRLSRRNFLLTLGAGAAAGAAAIVASGSRKSTVTGKTKRAASGYQESAHVRNYYRTAKV